MIKTLKTNKNTIAKIVDKICLNLPLNLFGDKLMLNYSKKYKNTTKNGNSLYNYTFYTMDKEKGIIINITWQVANALQLRYDFSKMHIIGYDELAEQIEKDLNVLIAKLTNYKEITIKQVL